jgi:hypothetical protein
LGNGSHSREHSGGVPRAKTANTPFQGQLQADNRVRNLRQAGG